MVEGGQSLNRPRSFLTIFPEWPHSDAAAPGAPKLVSSSALQGDMPSPTSSLKPIALTDATRTLACAATSLRRSRLMAE
jgi:hypothetical protein